MPAHLEQSPTWRLLELEEPLMDAIDYTQSLRLIGYGLLRHDDETGRAIIAVASAASDRLDELKARWTRARAANRRGDRKRKRSRR